MEAPEKRCGKRNRPLRWNSTRCKTPDDEHIGDENYMQLPPLEEGRLIKRYKRFLADVDFGDGVSCPLCRGDDRPQHPRQQSLVLNLLQSGAQTEENA